MRLKLYLCRALKPKVSLQRGHPVFISEHGLQHLQWVFGLYQQALIGDFHRTTAASEAPNYSNPNTAATARSPQSTVCFVSRRAITNKATNEQTTAFNIGKREYLDKGQLCNATTAFQGHIEGIFFLDFEKVVILGE